MTQTETHHTTSFTFTAHTADLCQALAAVSPFANEKIPTFATVRLFIDPTNITVTATNGNAAALAIASTFVMTTPDGEAIENVRDVAEVDLLPAQCRAIVSLFKAGATDADADDEPGAELRIDVDEHEVVITDASGLLEGQSLTLPRPPTVENAAAVLISVERRNIEGAIPQEGFPPVFYAPALALAIKAAKIYGSTLTFEHKAPTEVGRSGSTLVRVGQSFLALIVDAWTDEDDAKQQDGWASDWTTRLQQLRPAAVSATDTDTNDKGATR